MIWISLSVRASCLSIFWIRFVTQVRNFRCLTSVRETRRVVMSQKKPIKVIEKSKCSPVLVGCHGMHKGSMRAMHESQSKV